MNNYSAKYFAFARTGLYFGIKSLEFQLGDKILVPDFICNVIFKPLEDLGLNIINYQLDEKLSPNWNKIESIIKNEEIKFLFLVHFFGQPQNIRLVLKLKKKYDILIIEDNSHGFSGKINGKLLGTFGDISISSPRKILGYPYGGVLYYNYKKKLNVNSAMNFSNNIIQFIFQLLKIKVNNFPKIKNKIKSLINHSNAWSNPNLFHDDNKLNYFLDSYSYKKIIEIDWLNISQIRRLNWKKWSKFILKNDLKLVFKTVHPESCPWVIPAYAKDLKERNFWLEWGTKNGIDIFPWPTLSSNVISQNGLALNRWKRLLCFPLNFYPTDIKK